MDKLTFVQVGAGFAFCVVLLQVAVLVTTLVNSRRAQKREVSFETVFASVESVEEVRAELRDLKKEIINNGETRRQAIEAKVEAARGEARRDVAELHTKINKVDKDLGVLQGETEMINQNVQQLITAVNRAADRQLERFGK